MTAVPCKKVSQTAQGILKAVSGTYHGRPSDFHDLTARRLQSGFAPDHAGTVGKHHDADKRKAVEVPCEG